MFSFLFNNNILKVFTILGIAIAFILVTYKIDNLRKENYKLHTKIKQMEAVIQSCEDEKRVYRLYCATQEDIKNTNIEDLINENNNSNDTNNTIVIDFNRL